MKDCGLITRVGSLPPPLLKLCSFLQLTEEDTQTQTNLSTDFDPFSFPLVCFQDSFHPVWPIGTSVFEAQNSYNTELQQIAMFTAVLQYIVRHFNNLGVLGWILLLFLAVTLGG